MQLCGALLQEEIGTYCFNLAGVCKDCECLDKRKTTGTVEKGQCTDDELSTKCALSLVDVNETDFLRDQYVY